MLGLFAVTEQMLPMQDHTCLRGSEAAIDRKLLSERPMLEEGSIVVLEQVSCSSPEEVQPAQELPSLPSIRGEMQAGGSCDTQHSRYFRAGQDSKYAGLASCLDVYRGCHQGVVVPLFSSMSLSEWDHRRATSLHLQSLLL